MKVGVGGFFHKTDKISHYNFELSPQMGLNSDIINFLNTDATCFFAARKFKISTISVYTDYSDYKQDKMQKLGYLKENGYISDSPNPRKYVYDQLSTLKEFNLYPITKKILKIV